MLSGGDKSSQARDLRKAELLLIEWKSLDG